MPIQIVHEYPAPAGLLRRLARALVSLLGVLLILVGLLASVVPVISLVVIVVMLVADPGALRRHPPDASALIAALVAVMSLIIGIWLVRGRRRLVLFLRRFGFVGATQAVTFAVVRALGTSWRLVTLDDARISPVGARKRMRWFSIAVGILTAALVAWALFWMFGGGLEDMITGGSNRRLPETSLKGILSLLFLQLFVVPLVVLVFVFLLIILPTAFAAVVAIFAWSSYGAIRRAERAKTVDIAEEGQIEQTASAVVRRSRRIIGPRLAVARVASPIWQPVVRRFASVSSAVIIDISEPTENLLWEIETLRPQMRLHWIFIGEQAHLQRMTTTAAAQAESSLQARLSQLLDAEEVLAYSSDQQDLRRFARSLQARLETLSSAVTRS
jgi:hypothetical protein